MDITVLVKVVADRESLAFDPASRTAIRTEAAGFLDPLDVRAVRVARELRRPSEKVSVVAMGPPEAAARLAEVSRMGVDRVILISDEGLRGSDALATARVLAQAIRRLGRTIVLAGARSTDGDSGLVPAALGPLLWAIPVLGVRAIVRAPSGSALEVTADSETGWVRYRVRPPCVLAVGEKIAKPATPVPDPAAPPPLERWTVADLGLRPAEVGRPGSRTTVTAFRRTAPEHTPQIFDRGTAEERIAGAWAQLERLGRPPPALGPEPPPLPATEPYDREVLVLTSGRDGRPDPAALDLISEVRRRLPDHWPAAVHVGPALSPPERRRLGRAGAARGYGLAGGSDPPLPGVVALALERALDRRKHAAAVLAVANGFGREIIGRLAARRGLGAVTDAEEVVAGPAGQLVWTKPSLGGWGVADVVTHGRPSLATYRSHPRPAPPPAAPTSELDWIDIEFQPPRIPVEQTGAGVERGPEYGDFERSDLVVGVGSGIGGPEAIRDLLPQLGAVGASLAASRRVVDAGWVPVQLQVGLTGRSIAPDLGILVGASGRPNFLAGWRRARRLVAINQDAGAPVFGAVDVGIVGDWREILPGLLARLRR